MPECQKGDNSLTKNGRDSISYRGPLFRAVMLQIGVVILSFEEAGDLSSMLPWKSQDAWELRAELLSRGAALRGFVPVSTCNRIEYYYSLASSEDAQHTLFLQTLTEVLPPLAEGVLPLHLTGREAARHLLRLASGLESMVLGETEIRAQLKDAFHEAHEMDGMDRRLRVLFQHAFQESRGIRKAVPMGRLPLSVAAIATRHLLRRIAPQAENLKDLKEARLQETAVIIGSGPMSRQAAEVLSRYFKSIVLVNRSLGKIESMADRLQATMVPFQNFIENPLIVCKDGRAPAAIVTATSRDDAFITPDFLARMLNGCAGPGRVCVVDMALPPDVDPACEEDSRVSLVTMETIRVELQNNRQKREEASRLASEELEASLIRMEAAMISALSSGLLREIQREIREKSRMELETLLGTRLSHLNRKDIRMLYDWAIRAHREMNRIHKRGLESVLTHYYEKNGALTSQTLEPRE